MSGQSSRKKANSPGVESNAERLARIAEARQLFLGTALNMSWQLAVTIIVPLLIGVQLDNKYNSSPSYTLGALFIAVTLAVWVVTKTVKDVKQAQPDIIENKPATKGKTSVK